MYVHRHNSTTIKNNGAIDASAATMCNAAGLKLQAMLDEGLVASGKTRVHNLANGTALQAYKSRSNVSKFIFWDAFPKLGGEKYGTLYQLIHVLKDT